MALSGTITGTTANQYISSKIVWSATQHKSDNYSTVTATLYYSRTNSGYTTYGTWEGSITINGETTQGSKYLTITQNSNTEAITTTVLVPHNADGSKSITISATGGISGTSFSSTSISKSVSLDTIPRASSIHAANAYVGEVTTITINKASNNFTHTINYEFGTLSGTIATKTTASSIKWTIPTDFYWMITNSYNGVCTLTCITYSGNTSIGSSTYQFMINVRQGDSAPILNPIVEDTNTKIIALTGDKNILVKYYSGAYVDIGATAQNGATIKSTKVTVGGDSSELMPITFQGVESGTFVFTATDSRGFSTTQTVNKTLIEYVNLTCNIQVDAPTAEGNTTLQIFGGCFNGSFGATDNLIEVEYRYKANSGSYSEWKSATIAFNNNYYSASVEISGLNYLNNYTFQARATDKLQSVESYTRKVKTTPVFDWGEEDFNFNVPVNHNGIIVMNEGAGIAGVDSDGDTMINFTPNNNSNTVELGIGNYMKSQGQTDIFGHKVNIFSNTGVFVNGAQIAANKILWSGALHMDGSQTASLNELVSEQATGIVIVFSQYNNTNSTVLNLDWHSYFIPKAVVANHSGNYHTFNMMSLIYSKVGAKSLYIYDDYLSGINNNTASGSNNGITYNNSDYVLRYVIGV